MAKIKFGMMMTDARGKLGGQVFSKNRSGSYVRTKVTPVNPQTSFQQSNRALLGSISSNWSSLTSDQRNAWNGAVENWQKTNVFGDLTKPTGKNLFTGLNKNRVTHYPALAIEVMPPGKVEFVPVVILSGSYSVSTTAMSVFVSAEGGIAQDYRVRATPALSAGTTFIKNQLRTIGTVFNAAETGQISLSDPYGVRFGVVSPGMVIGVEVTPIAENGQLGVPSTFLITAVA